MVSFAEKVDRWIDALCADVRVFEDRALDPSAFERKSYDDGPTDEIRRPRATSRPSPGARV